MFQNCAEVTLSALYRFLKRCDEPWQRLFDYRVIRHQQDPEIARQLNHRAWQAAR
jgi:hypothetical protein